MLCWIPAEGTTYQEFQSQHQSPVNEQTLESGGCETQPLLSSIPSHRPSPCTDTRPALSKLGFPGSSLHWECSRAVQEGKEPLQPAWGGANQSSGTRAAFLLEKGCSRSSSVNCAFHLPLFSLKVLLAAGEADQERETRVSKISQYCQMSARSIRAGRHQKCRFHCAGAHKSQWEQQPGWGCWGGRRRVVKTQTRTRAAPVP